MNKRQYKKALKRIGPDYYALTGLKQYEYTRRVAKFYRQWCKANKAE